MAQSDTIQVFDQHRQRLAFLQNAFNIGYRKSLNSLWTASFSLPSDDPKNKYCKPFNLVELYDGKERVDLFRIIGEDLTRSTQAVTVYNCEHILATLIDDILFQYHQIGNINVFTSTVIRYILDRQTTQNWRLGRCDVSRQFEYKWENENLLAALFSVAKPFTERYIWDWNTTGYPWTLNLLLLDNDVKSEIRYGKNMTQITKTTDATNVITRLYCLGYGEGDNQLDIRGVNNGLPYIDSPTMATWGMKAAILADRRFEERESLKAYGQQILNGTKDPYVSYSAQAVDLYKLTGQRYDKYIVGDMVKVVDRTDGINDIFPIVEIEKSDLTGNPGGVNVTIANKTKDLSGSITDLQNRALINDLYAQGATNQVMVNFADNADKDNPALLKLYIPEGMVRVNSCVLNFEFEAFRAYERGVASAQQSVYSTSSTNTTVSSSSAESSQVQSTSSTSTQTPTTSTSNAQYQSTDSGGGSSATSSSVSLLPQNIQDSSNGGYGAANHNHGFTPGQQFITSVDFENKRFTSTGFVASGAHIHAAHSHTVNIPNHGHTVTIPSHSHSVTIPSHNHTVTIPGHSHTVQIPGHNHSVTIPAHTHDMQYGIFKTGGASVGKLYVNGKYIQDVLPNTNINLANMLADAKTKKISRDTFHRIEIYPVATTGNTQGLTRIVANIFMQIFTNSRGSGDF